jgi:predicted dehydrogenase
MHSIGFIGLDTSHVTAFAKLLNDPASEHHVPGGRVTVAWPGGSPDFALSADRVAGFTATLRDDFGVRMVDGPEAVAEACDLLFIESVDGRVHRGQFERTVKYGRPTFIDKPFATTLADARAMARLAAEAGVPLMTASSLRFADALQATLAKGRADIVGCNAFGPMSEQATQPGLFWYGCHTVEILLAVMGPGCRDVSCRRTETHDLLTAWWSDGRAATLHGLRGAHSVFGVTLHRPGGPETPDLRAGRPGYAAMLAAILDSIPHGRSAVPMDESLEIVALIEAANRSRQNDGARVTLEPA